MKPLCGFCGGHHYVEEPHPGEAVREALAKLRETEPPRSEIEVGRKTFAEAREQVASVTKPAVTSPVTPPSEPDEARVTPPPGSVTSPSSVTKEQAWRERNRDKVREANAKRQRAYRERQP